MIGSGDYRAYPAEGRDRVVRLLGLLCRAVVEAGFTRVELRDAVPRLGLKASTGVVVEVRIDPTGADFVWGSSGRRHPTSDVSGAAKELIGFVHALSAPVSGDSDEHP